MFGFSHCFVCGKEMRSRRVHMRANCSNKCRQWYYRYRHASDAAAKRMIIRLKNKLYKSNLLEQFRRVSLRFEGSVTE